MIMTIIIKSQTQLIITDVVALEEVDNGAGSVADHQHAHHRRQQRHHRAVTPATNIFSGQKIFLFSVFW